MIIRQPTQSEPRYFFNIREPSYRLHAEAIYKIIRARLAKAQQDLDWLWHLLGSIPAAEGQLGDLDESGLDVAGVIGAINAYLRSDRSAEEALRPQYIDYIPYPHHPWGYGNLAVRYDGNFSTISNAVQQAIHSVDRNLPISRVTTLDEQVSRTITNQRLVAQLSAFFGLLAVFLSCIGIYGLMSYMVSRRTNEIGIRIAIGASRANVRWRLDSDFSSS